MQICDVNSAYRVGELKIFLKCQWYVTFFSARAHDILSARGMSFSDHKTTTSVIGSSQV